MRMSKQIGCAMRVMNVHCMLLHMFIECDGADSRRFSLILAVGGQDSEAGLKAFVSNTSFVNYIGP